MKTSALRTVALSLVVAAAFEAALFSSKEAPSVYGHAPWLNDPYDTAVSFALFCIPLVVVPSALRLLASRQLPDPRSPERLADLLRACGVAAVVVAVTLAACWAAVAAGANRPAWNSLTAVQLAVLTLFSVSTIACAVGIRRAARALRPDVIGRPCGASALRPDAEANGPAARPAPDWLGDVIGVGRLLAGSGGPAGRPVTGVLDWADHRVMPLVRRHPVGAAAMISAAVGLLVAIPQSVNEGYRPLVALIFFCVTTGGVFAFVVTAGSYLRVIRTDRRPSPQGPVIHATVLAAAAVPAALAFRASLWSLADVNGHGNGLGSLFVLLATAALVAFGVTILGERIARASRMRRAARKLTGAWPNVVAGFPGSRRPSANADTGSAATCRRRARRARTGR